jgi:Putative transcriptional regulator
MPIENHNFFKIEHARIQPAPGRVLVSDPALSDFYFSRAVVLLTEHNEKGSIGFVLNKPIQAPLNELLKDFPEYQANISVGGPVNPNTVHFIHTLGFQITGAVHIFANLFWGGEIEELKNLIRQGLVAQNQVKFFFGYSGWAPEQLKTEMKLDAWVVSILETDIMMEPSRDMWKLAVANLGDDFRVWLNYPENPNMN